MNWLLQRLSENSTKLALAYGLQVAKAVPVLAPYAQAVDILTGLLVSHAAVTPDPQPAPADIAAQVASAVVGALTQATAAPAPAPAPVLISPLLPHA